MIRILILLLLLQLKSFALPPISELRERFYAAVESEKVTKSLYDELAIEKVKLTPLYQGYFGAIEALIAKHSWNPYNKLEYLSKGMKSLETAIALDKDNLELRFLRFSIQHYIPVFLGQSKNLMEDRDKMVEQIKKGNFKEEDRVLVKNVTAFLIETKRCTKEQELFLKGL